MERGSLYICVLHRTQAALQLEASGCSFSTSGLLGYEVSLSDSQEVVSDFMRVGAPKQERVSHLCTQRCVPKSCDTPKPGLGQFTELSLQLVAAHKMICAASKGPHMSMVRKDLNDMVGGATKCIIIPAET